MARVDTLLYRSGVTIKADWLEGDTSRNYECAKDRGGLARLRYYALHGLIPHQSSFVTFYIHHFLSIPIPGSSRHIN